MHDTTYLYSIALGVYLDLENIFKSQGEELLTKNCG